MSTKKIPKKYKTYNSYSLKKDDFVFEEKSTIQSFSKSSIRGIPSNLEARFAARKERLKRKEEMIKQQQNSYKTKLDHFKTVKKSISEDRFISVRDEILKRLNHKKNRNKLKTSTIFDIKKVCSKIDYTRKKTYIIKNRKNNQIDNVFIKPDIPKRIKKELKQMKIVKNVCKASYKTIILQSRYTIKTYKTTPQQNKVKHFIRSEDKTSAKIVQDRKASIVSQDNSLKQCLSPKFARTHRHRSSLEDNHKKSLLQFKFKTPTIPEMFVLKDLSPKLTRTKLFILKNHSFNTPINEKKNLKETFIDTPALSHGILLRNSATGSLIKRSPSKSSRIMIDSNLNKFHSIVFESTNNDAVYDDDECSSSDSKDYMNISVKSVDSSSSCLEDKQNDCNNLKHQIDRNVQNIDKSSEEIDNFWNEPIPIDSMKKALMIFDDINDDSSSNDAKSNVILNETSNNQKSFVKSEIAKNNIQTKCKQQTISLSSQSSLLSLSLSVESNEY